MLTKKEVEVLKLRKQGLTQSEIAKKLKISQAAISKFENNAYKKISESKKILEIAKILGVNTDKLEEDLI